MTCTIISDGKEIHASHRNEEEPPMVYVKNHVFILIQRLLAGGYDSFYVNAEYGVPLWAAEMLIAFRQFNKITVHIVIPYEEQTTEWSEDLRDRYFAVCEAADSVEIAATRYTTDSMELAERRMIDESDMLMICGENGSKAAAVQYAAKQEVEAVYCSI